MDFASFAGILSGIGLIISAIIIGGDVHNFINVPGLMIVFGGTVATTLLTFQFKDVINAYRAAYFVFTQGKAGSNTMVETMIKLCQLSRRVRTMCLFQRLNSLQTGSFQRSVPPRY